MLLASFAHIAPERLPTNPPSRSFVTVAQIFVESPQWNKVPAPVIDLDGAPIDLNALKLVHFEDSEQDSPAGVIGPASAPRLRRFQSVDVQDSARCARITRGHPITVVLTVRVGVDGDSESVDIVRSSGVATADEAAIDYALSLRWIPGTVNRNARAMSVQLPVTFTVAQ